MTGPSLADIMLLPEDNEVRRTLLNQGIGSDYDIFCESVEDAILEGITRMEAMKPQFSGLGDAKALNVVQSCRSYTATDDLAHIRMSQMKMI